MTKKELAALKKAEKQAALDAATFPTLFVKTVSETGQDEARQRLIERAINASPEKAQEIALNNAARLKRLDKYKSADIRVLEFIGQHADEYMMKYLLNPDNYYKSERFLNAATMLTGTGKYPTPFDAVMKALVKGTGKTFNFKMLEGAASQCESKTKNIVWALYPFGIVELRGFKSTGKVCCGFSKDTTIRFIPENLPQACVNNWK